MFGWLFATLGMALDAPPPGVASQVGASIAVRPTSWAMVEDARWRLVKTQERDPRTGRADARWRADGDCVDATVRHFNITLTPSPSLGIELGELLLGPEEAPLCLVDGVINGGAAAAHAAEIQANGGYAWAMPNDALIAVYPGREGAPGYILEAAPYDATVEAIGKALRATPPGMPITLTLGRIVRRGRALITAVEPDGSESQFVCYEGENLRMGLLRRGLRLNDQSARRYDNKPAGTGDCGGNGLCATCVVSVLNGGANLTPKRPSEANLLSNVARWRQSCRAYVQCPADETDVEVRIALKPRSEAESDGDDD